MPLLSHDYTSLRREIAVELGFNRVSASRTAAENEDIEDVLKLGLQYYYSPPILPRERTSHRWSFLRPIYSLATIANQENYTLPVEFGGVEGDITWVRDGQLNIRITQVNEGILRELRHSNISSATDPCHFAVWPASSTGSAQQQYILGLFPKPSAIFNLRFRYNALPSTLTTGNPYPLGMPLFADALRASMMAACELKMDDEYGKHWQVYQDRMAVAVSLDRANMENGSLGFNSDFQGGYDLQKAIRSYTGLTIRTR